MGENMKKIINVIGLSILFIVFFCMIQLFTYFGEEFFCASKIYMIFRFFIRPIYYTIFGMIFKLSKRYCLLAFIVDNVYNIFSFTGEELTMQGLQSVIYFFITGGDDKGFIPLIIGLLISNFILFLGACIVCYSREEN